MAKSESFNQIINNLEAIKSLITQAQNHLDEGDGNKAMEPLHAATQNLANLKSLFSNLKGNISTEHM